MPLTFYRTPGQETLVAAWEAQHKAWAWREEVDEYERVYPEAETIEPGPDGLIWVSYSRPDREETFEDRLEHGIAKWWNRESFQKKLKKFRERPMSSAYTLEQWRQAKADFERQLEERQVKPVPYVKKPAPEEIEQAAEEIYERYKPPPKPPPPEPVYLYQLSFPEHIFTDFSREEYEALLERMLTRAHRELLAVFEEHHLDP